MNDAMTGEKTVIEWTPDGGALTELSEFGRNFEPEETADVYDTTTYSEAQDGYKTFIPGLAEGKSKFEVMYQQADTTVYATLAPRTVGLLDYYPEGKATGKPKISVQAIVTKRSRPLPYDNVVIVSVEWQHSGKPTESTVPAP